MKITFLRQIAEILATIDDNKSQECMQVLEQSDNALAVLKQMKLADFDMGELPFFFKEIQTMHAQGNSLQTLIDKTHEEIVRLLGNDAWRVY
jgi:hypothetical protein